MAISQATSGRPTQGQNLYLDTLTGPGKWVNADGGTGPVEITYHFSEDTGAGVKDVGTWSDMGRQAYQQAFSIFSSFANVSFCEQADGSANFQLFLGQDDPEADGWSEMPGEHGDIILNQVDDSDWTDGSMLPGGYSFMVVMHELGHALGLDHPFDGQKGEGFPGISDANPTGKYGQNQTMFTIMSYEDGWDKLPAHEDEDWGWQATPMAFDIAALQSMYGANMEYHTGDDAYALPLSNTLATHWSCIWDAGGNDTLSAAGSNRGAMLDLRAAPLTGAHAGGYVSWVKGIMGGFTIAHGALIENAVGGNGADVINGNGAANRLTGNGGNDDLHGYGGNDVLNGGAGADHMAGGYGDDTYYVNSAKDEIEEEKNAGRDTVVSSISFRLAENFENLTLSGNAATNGTGNRLANVITGNGAANGLRGDNGNDWLYGKLGADTLTGGKGADRFVFDTAAAAGNADRITDFTAGQDKILLAHDALGLASPVGALLVSEFLAGTAAAGAEQHVVYDRAAGSLWLDADGSGDGVAVLLATLSNKIALGAGDFLVI